MIVDYVSQNKVRLVFRHFPVLGERSLRAALAAEAAAQQGQFWPYHDRLFEVLANEGAQAITDDRLRSLAADLGLNVETFNAATQDPETQRRVAAEVDQGRRDDVQRTPTLFVADQKVEGAIPYEELRQLLDTKLAPR